MTFKADNPGCDCCGCFCGKSTLYLTIHNVSMHLTPVECISPYFSQTIDETWYNGVTFLFDFDWGISELTANNPNAFDFFLAAIPCVTQEGYWQCVFELAVPGGAQAQSLRWYIGVSRGFSSGRLYMEITLQCQQLNGAGVTTTASRQVVHYIYENECPEGTPVEFFRGTPGTIQCFTNGHFNFENFTADLVWA